MKLFGKRIFFLTYALWWVFWLLVHGVVLYGLGWSWQVAFADAGVSNLLLALAGFATISTYRFYRPAAGKILEQLGWIIALNGLILFLLRWILQVLFNDDQNYILFLNSSLTFRFFYMLLIITLMGVMSWLWFYVKEQEQTKQRKDEVEKLLRDAELMQLRQQLQPHFLFNSLNSINALIGSNPEQARIMILHLSDFLRGTLKKDEQKLVAFADEIKHLKLYLEIEKVRFGNRLNVIINDSADVLDLKLPSLLLQPIVENAIKFGLYDTTGIVTITINATLHQNHLVIQIINPFDPQTSISRPGTGFGLESVQRRLHLIYSNANLLSTERKENTFITTIKLPQTQ